MKVASALIQGSRAEPALVSAAVTQALARADLTQAGQVILFLTRHFQRQAGPAVLAAARAAGCLQVAGCTTSGVLTEEGWQSDQPAAAVLVLESPAQASSGQAPALSFSGHARLPYAWQDDRPRAGLLDTDAVAWEHGRIAEQACAEIRLPGWDAHILSCPGIRPLGEAGAADCGLTYDLQSLGGQRPIDSLRRLLPAALRDKPPVHQLALIRATNEPAIALLGIHGDGSMSLAEQPQPGEILHWGIRQALFAESEIRETLTAAVHTVKSPKFAMLLSCIGRGSLFYGDDDRDLQALRDNFPELPIIGAYGTGQLIPLAGRNHLFHNTALTLLFESAYV